MTEQEPGQPHQGASFIQALDIVYHQLKAAHERELQTLQENATQRPLQAKEALTAPPAEKLKHQASLSRAHLDDLLQPPPKTCSGEGFWAGMQHITHFQRSQSLAQGGKGKAKPPVTRIERLVARPSFQIWCSVVILMNCLRVAFYTDWTIRNSYARLDGLEKGVTNFWFDAPFAVWFCFEVCLRMYAAGIRSFYCDEDKYWNIFDTLLALESALSLMMRLTTARFSALRVLCIFRVARLVKHMDMVQGLRRMRAVFIALSTSVHDFASAAVVVGVVLFAYSVFLSMAAASYFERMDQLNSEQPLSAEQLQEVAQVVETFGSLPNMMVSLWAAISGGDDWMSYGDLLKKMDPAHRYFWTFVCFTAFSVVGLLNVVTGVFVDSAVSAAEACKSEDEVTASQRKEEEVEEKKLKAVLVKADEDGSGHITSEELDEHLAERNNQALWSHLGFAPKQVKMIFKLKERWAQNREGTDKVDELLFFMRNCKGPASHVDILSLMYDHMQLATSMQGNFTALQKSIDKLEQKLGASGQEDELIDFSM